jgi:hypothetical protein
MKQHRRLRTFCILAALFLCTVSVSPVRGQAIIGETWEDKKQQIIAFIDAAASTAAGEALPPGAMDIVNVLRASPDIVKQGLREVLKQRTTAAILDDDWDRVDRLQAFSSCLEGDCARLDQLRATWKPGEPAVGAEEAEAPVPDATPTAAQPKCCLGDGDGPHFCCQWTHPVSKQTTCSPAKNRPLCQSLERGKAVDNADCMAIGPDAGTCKPR